MSATTYTVTTLADSGAGSLRQEITDADTKGGTSTINFQTGLSGAIVEASQLPAITANITLHGPGASVISIQGTTIVGALYVGLGVTAEIDNLSISNSGSSTSQATGAGIYNAGTLTVSNCTISNNVTAASGGGIYNDQSGDLTIKDSTLSNNSAATGGGLASFYGTVALIGDTITGNSATGTLGDGGGGVSVQSSEVTITNTTITGNTSSIGGAGIDASTISLAITDSTITANDGPGGGLATSADVTLNGTIIAANASEDIDAEGLAAGSLTGSNDLIGDGSGPLSALVATQAGTEPSPINPLLGPLADNGGPTQTLALLAGSPAIGQGAVFAAANGVDQRGITRPSNAVDIGAYQTSSGGGGGGGGSATGLTPTITKSTVPLSVVGGTLVHGTVTVSVNNSASTTDSGPNTIAIYASADGTVDSSSILLGKATPKLSVRSGATQNNIAVPVKNASVPPGNYSLFAQATDPSSDVITSAPGFALTVAAPFLALTETVTTTGLASSVVSGTKSSATAKVIIVNNGNVAAKGNTIVALSASTDPDVAGTAINSVTTHAPIPADGGKATVVVPFKALPDLADDDYFITATVTDPDGNSTVASTGGTTTIAAPFVSLALAFGNIPRTVLTAGAPLIITNSGNVDDNSSFTATIGFATDAAGTNIVGTSAGKLAPAHVTIKAGKSGTIHVTGWNPLFKSLAESGPYFLTVILTDASGNTASAVSTGELG